MLLNESLVRVTAAGKIEQIMIPAGSITQAMLADLLHTDVTERLRTAAVPQDIAPADQVLCYFIDARGGEKQLPSNALGTCLYHTGCPIYGDLLFALCSAENAASAVSGFNLRQSAALLEWLRTEFAVFLE